MAVRDEGKKVWKTPLQAPRPGEWQEVEGSGLWGCEDELGKSRGMWERSFNFSLCITIPTLL